LTGFQYNFLENPDVLNFFNKLVQIDNKHKIDGINSKPVKNSYLSFLIALSMRRKYVRPASSEAF